MKVVFFGTPQFAAEVLEFLLQHQVNIVAIISKPDRAKGRVRTPVPTPVKLIALQHPEISLYQPEMVSDLSFAQTLESHQADLFVVVAYGEIIKQHLLDMPKLGCINLHASLLPYYRGAAPIQRAIMEGQAETGVTIMHMVRKMDAGDMIDVTKIPIGSEAIFGDIEKKLCEVGKESLLYVIKHIQTDELSRTPQNHELATLAPKIELEDCQIDWSKSAQEIHNLVRGVNPYPGAWCYITLKHQQKRLKINRTRIVACSPTYPSGTLISHLSSSANLIVATGDQALELIEVQLEGKKLMSSSEFARGFANDQISFMK